MVRFGLTPAHTFLGPHCGVGVALLPVSYRGSLDDGASGVATFPTSLWIVPDPPSPPPPGCAACGCGVTARITSWQLGRHLVCRHVPPRLPGGRCQWERPPDPSALLRTRRVVEVSVSQLTGVQLVRTHSTKTLLPPPSAHVMALGRGGKRSLQAFDNNSSFLPRVPFCPGSPSRLMGSSEL